MRSQAANFTPKRGASKPTLKRAGFKLVFVWTCITPALFSQQDVHAALISSVNRKPAPTFQLVTDAGTKLRISDYRGRVVLLNFWATDCGGCVLEIPSFIELEKAHKDKGFAAIGVSMDISYEDLKDANEAWSGVRPFMAKHGVNYTIAMTQRTMLRSTVTASPCHNLHKRSGAV